MLLQLQMVWWYLALLQLSAGAVLVIKLSFLVRREEKEIELLEIKSTQ